MRAIWTLEAEHDRNDIWEYIAADHPNAAARLAIYPMLGREGKISGTRELILHESYCLIYEVVGEKVWILALVHAARQWPPVHD